MQNKLLYSELTKGSSFILAFFFLALFSFQDAVFVVFLRFFALFKVPFSSGDLFIIPHFRMFVKPFFKLFSKFFGLSFAKAFYLRSLSSLSPDRLVWISLASHFFAKLSSSKTLRFSQVAALFRPSSFALSSDSFIIIPRFWVFVNTFRRKRTSSFIYHFCLFFPQLFIKSQNTSFSGAKSPQYVPDTPHKTDISSLFHG